MQKSDQSTAQEPQASAPTSRVHDEHPLRHWSRTCPACNESIDYEPLESGEPTGWYDETWGHDRNMDGAREFINAILMMAPLWPNAWGQDVAAAAFFLTGGGKSDSTVFADAARYRWLKENWAGHQLGVLDMRYEPHEWDAYIDAASERK